MSDFLEVTSTAHRELLECSEDLHYFAKALSICGNSELATELRDIASSVQRNAKAINEAIRKDIHDSVKASQESFGNVIKACLDNSLLKEEG